MFRVCSRIAEFLPLRHLVVREASRWKCHKCARRDCDHRSPRVTMDIPNIDSQSLRWLSREYFGTSRPMSSAEILMNADCRSEWDFCRDPRCTSNAASVPPSCPCLSSCINPRYVDAPRKIGVLSLNASRIQTSRFKSLDERLSHSTHGGSSTFGRSHSRRVLFLRI